MKELLIKLILPIITTYKLHLFLYNISSLQKTNRINLFMTYLKRIYFLIFLLLLQYSYASEDFFSIAYSQGDAKYSLTGEDSSLNKSHEGGYNYTSLLWGVKGDDIFVTIGLGQLTIDANNQDKTYDTYKLEFSYNLMSSTVNNALDSLYIEPYIGAIGNFILNPVKETEVNYTNISLCFKAGILLNISNIDFNIAYRVNYEELEEYEGYEIALHYNF